MLWIACSLALLGADDKSSGPAPGAVAGCQWHATSPNFAIRNFHPAHDARQVAEYCERWRAKLQKYWIAAEQDTWAAKC